MEGSFAPRRGVRELATLIGSAKLPISGAGCPQVRPGQVLRHGVGLYLVGAVAAHGARIIDIGCGRRDRHERLTMRRALAQHGSDASVREILMAQIRKCPHRDDTRLQTRSDLYRPDLVRLYGAREPRG